MLVSLALSKQRMRKSITCRKIAEGKFKDEIVPVTVEETFVRPDGRRHQKEFVVDTDECVRAETNMETLD